MTETILINELSCSLLLVTIVVFLYSIKTVRNLSRFKRLWLAFMNWKLRHLNYFVSLVARRPLFCWASNQVDSMLQARVQFDHFTIGSLRCKRHIGVTPSISFSRFFSS